MGTKETYLRKTAWHVICSSTKEEEVNMFEPKLQRDPGCAACGLCALYFPLYLACLALVID